MGNVRHISLVVKVAGSSCLCKSLDVCLTTQQNSDTLNATLAMQGQPLAVDFWATCGEVDVEGIFDGVTVFIGSLDTVDLDYDGQEIKLSARDKSKGPIEAKSTESFKNKTATGIVSEIAGRHGLTPVLDATGDKAGKTQQIDWVKNVDQISEWTLVQHLADREGKVAYVTKNELHFKDLDDDSLGTITVTYGAPSPAHHALGNFLSCKIARNLQAGRPTEVSVHSWHTKKKEALHEKDAVGGDGPKIEHHYEHAGLERGQARKMAKKRCREITRHELTVDCQMVGDPAANPRMKLVLVGFGALSQSYFIDKVHHQGSSGHGYVMDITARNTSKSRGGGGSGDAAGGPPMASDGASAASLGSRSNLSNNGSISGGQ